MTKRETINEIRDALATLDKVEGILGILVGMLEADETCKKILKSQFKVIDINYLKKEKIK